jgi:hypothetical protein
MHEFQKAERVVRVLAPQAAGTSNVNTTGVNTAGFESVEFIVGAGALTATQVTSLKLQSSDTDGSYADVTGAVTTALADGNSNTLMRVELFNPQKPWVRAVVNRGTANAVIDLGVAILRGPQTQPITEDATVAQTKVVVGA